MSRKNNWAEWNERLLAEKVRKGLISSFRRTEPAQKPRQIRNEGRYITKHFKRQNKALEWVSWNLLFWCNERALQLQEEYRFCEDRKFRFDFAISAVKIAVEYEGGIHLNASGHTSARGVRRDIEKYELAAQDGWVVIRVHSKNHTELIEKLNFWYQKKNKI